MITKEWLVVSEKNSWGAGDTLAEACKNAQLLHLTKLDFIEGYLGLYGNLRQDLAQCEHDWNDYGRDEYRHKDQPSVEIVIYHLRDDSYFQGFDVSPFDGSVTAIPKDNCKQLDRGVLQEAFTRCTLPAYWKNGDIVYRPAPSC